MSNTIEEEFVNTFIIKNKRERLLFELSGKNRIHGIGRFCHDADEMLIKVKIVVSGNYLYYDEIKKIVKKYADPKKCYIMAIKESFDGMVCGFDEALELVLGNGMAAIIVSDSIVIA